jgi:hypothetical protein
MIKPIGKTTNICNKPEHNISIIHDNGEFTFNFSYGTLHKIHETINLNGGGTSNLMHLTQSEFITVFKRIEPTMWSTAYYRGVAKCKLNEIMKLL